MNLEDHLGDILRKARKMANISPAAAAKAAGLTEAELAQLEDSGSPAEQTDLSALAALVGLHESKLGQIARGWLPAPKELGTWRELRCFSTSANDTTVNAYLAWDEVTREAALFDTGWDAREALETIAEYQLVLPHLFISHTH